MSYAAQVALYDKRYMNARIGGCHHFAAICEALASVRLTFPDFKLNPEHPHWEPE